MPHVYGHSWPFASLSALYTWISAKVDCRRVFLQDSSSPYAYTLISSSPWTPSLFPVEVVLELSKSPALQGRSLLEQMGWTKSRHNLLKKERSKLDTCLPGLLPSSSGGGRRPSGPPLHRASGPSYSSNRPAKRGRWDPRPRQDSRKPPFCGAKGSHGARGASYSSRGSASGQRRN